MLLMKGVALMRWILKIIAAPFVVALTITVAVLTFLFCYAVAVLQVISGIGVLISIIMLVTGEKLGGIVFLILSFLISPLGIPAIAEWLIDKLDDLNYSLRNYITS